MSISEQLVALVGKWQGTNKLWLDPATSAKESNSVLLVSLAARKKFAMFQYTWADEGEEQEGLLIIGSAGQSFQAQVIWADSWHMQDKYMVCNGSMESNGGFLVSGTYEAPPGPDWGWRIMVTPLDMDTLQLNMYNVTPDGQEFLAVETIYRRNS